MAPSRMYFAIVAMRSLPSGADLTRKYKTRAMTSAATPVAIA